MSNAVSKVVCIDSADSVLTAIEQPSNLQDLLAEGYKCFDRFQNRDALRWFREALHLDSENEEAGVAYNQVMQRIVARWHFSMLNDGQRNEAFDAAIRRAVAGKTVLDIGSGSGLLAMMAARAGAERIYTCEMNDVIADFAERIVSANGYANKIKIIAKKSQDLVLGNDLAEKVDVLVTETVDSALLGEGIIPIVLHARKHLLREGGQIIPRRARMYAALLQARDVWEMNRVDVASGFDVSLFNHLATDGFYPVRLDRFEHRFLSESFRLCQFDFMVDALKPRRFDIPLVATETGECHAIAYWFDLYVDDDTSFSTSPLNGESHWKQAVQCFTSPVTLHAGQQCSLSVRQNSNRFAFELVGSSGRLA
jgi:type II protein arginine methyltransferase